MLNMSNIYKIKWELNYRFQMCVLPRLNIYMNIIIITENLHNFRYIILIVRKDGFIPEAVATIQGTIDAETAHQLFYLGTGGVLSYTNRTTWSRSCLQFVYIIYSLVFSQCSLADLLFMAEIVVVFFFHRKNKDFRRIIA